MILCQPTVCVVTGLGPVPLPHDSIALLVAQAVDGIKLRGANRGQRTKQNTDQ
jgi:hypothetical protein